MLVAHRACSNACICQMHADTKTSLWSHFSPTPKNMGARLLYDQLRVTLTTRSSIGKASYWGFKAVHFRSAYSEYSKDPLTEPTSEKNRRSLDQAVETRKMTWLEAAFRSLHGNMLRRGAQCLDDRASFSLLAKFFPRNSQHWYFSSLGCSTIFYVQRMAPDNERRCRM